MIPAAQLVAMVGGGENGEPGWGVLACRVFMWLVHRRRTIMHSARFDAIARSFARSVTRRRAAKAGLGAAATGVLSLVARRDVAAGKTCTRSCQCSTGFRCALQHERMQCVKMTCPKGYVPCRLCDNCTG